MKLATKYMKKFQTNRRLVEPDVENIIMIAYMEGQLNPVTASYDKVRIQTILKENERVFGLQDEVQVSLKDGNSTSVFQKAC